MNRYSLQVLPVAVLIIVIAAITLTGRRAESDTGRIGRFQVVSGCYVASIGKGVIEKDDLLVSNCGVFKVDTVTGDTWIYRERVNTQSVVKNEVTGEWEPVN